MVVHTNRLAPYGDGQIARYCQSQANAFQERTFIHTYKTFVCSIIDYRFIWLGFVSSACGVVEQEGQAGMSEVAQIGSLSPQQEAVPPNDGVVEFLHGNFVKKAVEQNQSAFSEQTPTSYAFCILPGPDPRPPGRQPTGHQITAVATYTRCSRPPNKYTNKSYHTSTIPLPLLTHRVRFLFRVDYKTTSTSMTSTEQTSAASYDQPRLKRRYA